jgi:hypothetical protein
MSYEGDFKDGKREGYGKLTLKNKGMEYVYIGHFTDQNLNDIGIL